MNRMDRYILGLFWAFFGAGAVVFTTLFIAMDLMQMMMTYQGVAVVSWFSYAGLSVPETLYRMTPIAAVLGTLFTLGTLVRSNELMALQSIGQGLLRVCWPIFASVLFLSLGTYIAGDRLLPVFAKQKNYVFFQQIKKNPSLYSTVRTNKIWYRSQNAIFYIKTLNESAGRAQGLTLYYFDEAWNLLQLITAEEVDLQEKTWRLRNGSVTVFAQESSFPLASNFKDKTIPMGEGAAELAASGNTSDVLTLRELSEFIERNREAGLDTLRYEVDYHAKFGFSVAGLVMVALGIPFAVGSRRSGGMMRGLSVGLGLVFAYWLLYSSALALGNFGYLAPWLAAWLPNVLMTLVAAQMWRQSGALGPWRRIENRK